MPLSPTTPKIILAHTRKASLAEAYVLLDAIEINWPCPHNVRTLDILTLKLCQELVNAMVATVLL